MCSRALSRAVCISSFLASVAVFASNEMALIQYNADAHFGDYESNMAALSKLAQSAVSQGGKLIVLPEGSAYGYASGDAFWCAPERLSEHRECVDVRRVAEPIPGGKTSEFWEQFARQNQAYVFYSLPEVEGPSFYNTTAVAGPSGFVAKYRKRSLYYLDEFYAKPGNLGPTVVSTPYGRFGLLICMDGNYDRYFREYRSKGVSRIILPMDWDESPDGDRAARLLFPKVARASGVDIFISDVSPWDGTGVYLHDRGERVRAGMPSTAPGLDGIVHFSLNP